MADDTRQSTTASPAPTAYPAPTAQDTAQEAVRYRTPANSLPGGTAHTAGGEKVDDESLITKAVRTIKPEDFLNVPYQPCAKDSLMTGMLSGFAMGGLMGIVGRNVWTACNIAVYSFCLSSAGSYSYCQYRRSIERDGLRQVQAVASKKKAEHEAKRRKEQAAKLAEQRRLEEERKKTWSYWAEKNLKFWGSEK